MYCTIDYRCSLYKNRHSSDDDGSRVAFEVGDRARLQRGYSRDGPAFHHHGTRGTGDLLLRSGFGNPLRRRL